MADYYLSPRVAALVAGVLALTLARALVARRRPAWPGRPGRPDLAPLAAFVALNAGVAAAFVVTPYPREWHLATAAGRLLFLPHLALYALALTSAQALLRRKDSA
jgi:hypothetical protein